MIHSTLPLKISYVHVNFVGTKKLYASYVKVRVSNFVGTIIKKLLILPTLRFLKLISSKCSNFLLSTYFSTDSRYSYGCRLVPLSIETSYSGISRITKRSQPYPVISRSDIDNVPSLNNSTFGDFVDLIYPIELEIKVTTNTARSNS